MDESYDDFNMNNSAMSDGMSMAGVGRKMSTMSKASVLSGRSSVRSSMVPGENVNRGTAASGVGVPAVSNEDLFAYVRHGKFKELKDSLDYLTNKPFDESFIQVKLFPLEFILYQE